MSHFQLYNNKYALSSEKSFFNLKKSEKIEKRLLYKGFHNSKLKEIILLCD